MKESHQRGYRSHTSYNIAKPPNTTLFSPISLSSFSTKNMLERQSLALPVLSTLLLIWLLYRTVAFFRFRHKYNFPNLVPGVPLFGNMLQIPKDTAGRRLYLHQLAEKYGEMYIFSRILIVKEDAKLTAFLV